MKAQLVQWKFESPVGPLYLIASPTGLQGLYWNEQDVTYTCVMNPILIQARDELTEYFVGNRTSFSIPLELIGTPFQISVWNELLKIPYAQTFSYRKLASCIKKHNAVRAVGSANGKNPLCIIVPCHRVIASDGTLGGYSGGLETKKSLLNLESLVQGESQK